MRSVLLGVALSGWFAGPVLAQCVHVACLGSSGNSSASSTIGSSTVSQHEATQTVTITQNAPEISGRDEVVREPHAHGGHHTQLQQRLQHSYRHGYRDGYQDGYWDRGSPKGHLTKPRTPNAVGHSINRRTKLKAKRAHSSPTNSSARAVNSQPFVDTVKDRATSYEAASNGSAISLASQSQSLGGSSWSLSSSISNWPNQGGTTFWPAMPMQPGGMICGWSLQTIITPDGRTLPPQQSWVCQCPQGWRPAGY